MAKFKIAPELLRKLMRYEPETGKLFWRERVNGSVQWNARHAGNEAMCCVAAGYLVGRLHGKNHRAHRVAWAIFYGKWPHLIDHIDGNGLNNKICNLRDVDQTTNMQNASLSVRNTSGHVGVHFDKARGKWAASIRANYINIRLGRFKCITAAILARKSAELKYGFHENHGRA